MDARLDAPFESWGGFSESTDDSSVVPGRLRYDPTKGIELDLVDDSSHSQRLATSDVRPQMTIYGQLVDGTLITLFGCFWTSGQVGPGIGAPTTYFVNWALFGCHIPDLGQLRIKRYSMELSSLANWTCVSPAMCTLAKSGEDVLGFDITCRHPEPIRVGLASGAFDVEIAHALKTQRGNCSIAAHWKTTVTIDAHTSVGFDEASQAAWQCQNLLSLLVGQQISARSLLIEPSELEAQDTPDMPLQVAYRQVARHDHPDVHSPLMLLPYSLIRDEFPQIVERWFARSEQAVLATDVFFGSQHYESPSLNVRFLALLQAAESYHRSLGTGLYMDQAMFEAAIQEFNTHMPTVIEGDHRQSLKNRLKYGNEHSLRKRLTDMLDRIPESVRTQIAGDVTKFVSRAVDTRNYYTHYDHTSQANALDGRLAHVAAERIRILIVANLLHDLGINDDKLLGVLERSRTFRYWMREPLPL